MKKKLIKELAENGIIDKYMYITRNMQYSSCHLRAFLTKEVQVGISGEGVIAQSTSWLIRPNTPEVSWMKLPGNPNKIRILTPLGGDDFVVDEWSTKRKMDVGCECKKKPYLIDKNACYTTVLTTSYRGEPLYVDRDLEISFPSN